VDRAVRAFVAVDTGVPLVPGEAPRAASAPSHLTLRFLGEVAPEPLARVIAVLPAAVAPVAPFDLALGGVGAFPSPDRPRVVWVGVTEGAAQVRRLAARVSDALAPIGWPAEPGEFVPHVTLFRVRSPRDRDRARALLGGTALAPAALPVRVRAVALKESRLGPHGAEHRVVREFPLGDAGSG
jgi:RNA 2',3'-cyclic 3'-phosphodiesterase